MQEVGRIRSTLLLIWERVMMRGEAIGSISGFLLAPMRAFYVIDSPNNDYRSSRRHSKVKMS